MFSLRNSDIFCRQSQSPQPGLLAASWLDTLHLKVKLNYSPSTPNIQHQKHKGNQSRCEKYPPRLPPSAPNNPNEPLELEETKHQELVQGGFPGDPCIRLPSRTLPQAHGIPSGTEKLLLALAQGTADVSFGQNEAEGRSANPPRDVALTCTRRSDTERSEGNKISWRGCSLPYVHFWDFPARHNTFPPRSLN